MHGTYPLLHRLERLALAKAYLALTRVTEGAVPAQGATFEPWYRFFPWEDWRQARPEIIARDIVPALSRWAGQDEAPEAARALSRRRRD